MSPPILHSRWYEEKSWIYFYSMESLAGVGVAHQVEISAQQPGPATAPLQAGVAADHWSPVRRWWSSVWPQQHPSPTAFPQVNPSDPALITLTFSVSHFQSVAVKRRIGLYSAVIPRCSEVVTIPVCRWPGAGPLTPALPSGETSNNVNKILICFSSITKTIIPRQGLSQSGRMQVFCLIK